MIKRAALLLCCAVASLATPVHAQTPAHPHQVIFVVTSGDIADWREALVLADHYLAGIKPEQAEVEVLAYSAGILMLAKTAASAEQLASVSTKGVHFVACENAMRTRNLTRADLLPGVTTVPSGVVELVRRQEAGWSYVKVGR